MGTHRTIRQPNGYCENLPHTTFCHLATYRYSALETWLYRNKRHSLFQLPWPRKWGSPTHQKRNGPEMGGKKADRISSNLPDPSRRSRSLALGTSAQKAELIAFTQALELRKGTILNFLDQRDTSSRRLADWSHCHAESTRQFQLPPVDMFSGWAEAFPDRTETAAGVAKALLKEIIPEFGLPGSLQTDNGPAFVLQVMKGITSVLDVKWDFTLNVETPIIGENRENRSDPEMGFAAAAAA